jgi:hypothetical protein
MMPASGNIQFAQDGIMVVTGMVGALTTAIGAVTDAVHHALVAVAEGAGDVRISPALMTLLGAMFLPLLGAAGAAIGVMFRTIVKANEDEKARILQASNLHIAAVERDKDAYYAELKKERDAFRSMLVSAVANLEAAGAERLKESGLVPPRPLAPVIPESNSPPTKEQQDAADMATLGAKLTAASLVLGLPARPKPDDEDDEARLRERAAAHGLGPAGSAPEFAAEPGIMVATHALDAIRENTEAVDRNTRAIEAADQDGSPGGTPP